MKKVMLYSDGACSGNPGPGGYGTILFFTDAKNRVHRKELSGGNPQTTNNRMEISGVLEGLLLLKEPCEVEVYSDSRYVVDAVSKGWLDNWQKRSWIRGKNEPVLNVDLWQKLLPLLAMHKVQFHWLKGHAGHAENERCDELAREAIQTILS